MPIEGLLMSSDSERPQPNFGALDLKVGSTRIGNLPPEVLGLIFALVHQELKTQKGALFEGMRALSTTCKDWNQLASSIPELWSFIDIVVNFDQEGMHMTTHSHLSAITTFLKLSRDVPLSLTLEIYGSSRRIETSSISNRILKHITAAFHLLSNDFHRWRSITCKTNPPMVPSIPEGSVAPYLEHIDISFHSDELQEAAYCRALVAAAPNLRSYVENRFDRSTYGVPDQMPWAQLRKFHFSNAIPAKQVLFLLDRAKSLVEFCFMMLKSMDFFLAEPPLSRTISMIRSMTIFSERPREIQELLSRLDTPNLDSLVLQFAAFDFTRFFVLNLPQHCSISILPFLSSASDSFRLSSLGLHNLIVDESEFIDCLRILSPSLTDLTIRTDGLISPLEMVTNTVLKSLTSNGLTQSEGQLCPLLKNLTLKRCVGADDGVLSDMVQSRLSSETEVNTRPGSHGTAVALTMLKHLDVVFTVHTHHVDEKRLNDFYEKGLVRGAVQFAPTQVGHFHASKLYNNSGGFQ